MSDPDAPKVPNTGGEPGTVAVTVPPKSQQAATYRHEPAPGTPKLRLKDVSITYLDRAGRGTEAVRDVSLDILDKPGVGEIVVFLGPSGCGKSTILKAIAGLLTPTAGEILLDGKPVTDVGRDRGMVFQAYTSFGWLTVRENLEYGLRLQGVPKAERRERSDRYLQSVGLAEFADRYPKDLSGGMKQRVAIARTLINRPKVILMDEPFGALDPQTRWGMQSLLLDVSRTEDNTNLFVTHDVSEAVYLADTVYVLSSRPARILHRVDVPYFAVHDVALKSAPEFREVEKQLLDLLYAPAAPAAPAAHRPHRA
jgi:NitT/TauT family transport system ATP-binding protein